MCGLPRHPLFIAHTRAGASPCVSNAKGMSWETTDVWSADTTDVLSADTTDVLFADITDGLSTACFSVGELELVHNELQRAAQAQGSPRVRSG